MGCDALGRRVGLALRQFLLTHPVWDVTLALNQLIILIQISTHTSRVGCDLQFADLETVIQDFYSHIPCGM